MYLARTRPRRVARYNIHNVCTRTHRSADMSSSTCSGSGCSGGSSSEDEWVDSCDYGDPQYWERYYRHNASQRGADTEWYAPLAAFLSIMPTPAQLKALRAARDVQQSELRTLVLGCGNSELSEHLRDAGYGNVVSIDISAVCVQQMQQHHASDAKLSFVQGDVRDMKRLFPDGSFDLVVDKATLDAVFIASGTENGTYPARRQCYPFLSISL